MTDPATLTVVLRPADGSALPPGGPTAATLGDSTPDPQAVDRVRSFFAGRGFELGAFVGIAFSITGPREAVLDLFGDVPDVGALGLDRLPGEIRASILSVQAEPPLDFGPPSF